MPYKISKITNNIIEFRMDNHPEYLTNTYLILGNHGNYLIDTGFGSGTIDEMKKYFNTSKPNYIINTHHHYDHIWGNNFVPNATLICHKNCRIKITEKWGETIKEYGQFIDGDAVFREPNITFDSKLYLNNELELFYSPGHTDDCIGIYFYENNILFVGDNFGDDNNDIIPFLECSKAIFINSLKLYQSYNADLYLSGHNLPQKNDFILSMIKMLSS